MLFEFGNYKNHETMKKVEVYQNMFINNKLAFDDYFSCLFNYYDFYQSSDTNCVKDNMFLDLIDNKRLENLIYARLEQHIDYVIRRYFVEAFQNSKEIKKYEKVISERDSLFDILDKNNFWFYSDFIEQIFSYAVSFWKYVNNRLYNYDYSEENFYEFEMFIKDTTKNILSEYRKKYLKYLDNKILNEYDYIKNINR